VIATHRALRVVAALALASAAAACAHTEPSPSPSAATAAAVPVAKATPHLSRARQEAIFARSINRENTADRVTGDLSAFAGAHVRYDCDVEDVVGPHTILGQCGADVEPVDLFINMPPMRLHKGDRWRILGTLLEPVPTTDIGGHTVFYAFVQAMFVDPAPPEATPPPILFR
jgi:hypothetical protein